MDKQLMTDRLLDEEQAAQMLCCSPALLRKWRLFRTGPAYCKIGRLVRYPLGALQAYMESCRVGGATMAKKTIISWTDHAFNTWGRALDGREWDKVPTPQAEPEEVSIG